MEPFARPQPSAPRGDRIREWVVWFGVGRLVATSIATIVVVAGGIWLLRSPTPPTEASLPRASDPPSTVDVAPTSTPLPEPSASSVPEPQVATPMLVHVAGAVVEPGVYELVADARVRDALVAAGGPLTEADWNALNLAAPLADGTRVYVPRVGEEVTVALVSGGSAPPGAVADGAPDAGPVDVNRATAAELDVLPGVGPATAAAIVTERERAGPFTDVDDLDRVPGIGPAKLEALRDLVTT